MEIDDGPRETVTDDVEYAPVQYDLRGKRLKPEMVIRKNAPSIVITAPEGSGVLGRLLTLITFPFMWVFKGQAKL